MRYDKDGMGVSDVELTSSGRYAQGGIDVSFGTSPGYLEQILK